MAISLPALICLLLACSSLPLSSSLRPPAPSPRTAPFSFFRSPKSLPPPPPPLPPAQSISENSRNLFASSAWLALSAATLYSSKENVANVFGLDQSTFMATVLEPAAGLSELPASLWPLEASLLTALAYGTSAVSPADRGRIGVVLALATASNAAIFINAFAGGLEVTNTLAIEAFATLLVATGASAARALKDADEPFEEFVADVKSITAPAESLQANFYRGSLVLSVIGEQRGERREREGREGGREGGREMEVFSVLCGVLARLSIVLFGGSRFAGSLRRARSFFWFLRSSFLPPSFSPSLRSAVSFSVGLSFLLSPVSPISIFETESTVSFLVRQTLGVSIVFLLAPVQVKCPVLR